MLSHGLGDVILEFQSTLPVRGATCTTFNPKPDAGISIHAPREGSDYKCPCCGSEVIQFQSTLPVRGATSETHCRLKP